MLVVNPMRMTEGAAPIGQLAASETDAAGTTSEVMPRAKPDARARLRALLDQHFDFVWRSVRRLGVTPAFVDDATQQVFWIASRKLDSIVTGREKSFLFSVAVRIASDARRLAKRDLERKASAACETDLFSHIDPLADELLDRKRMRVLLDDFLDGLSSEVRTAFVLFEAEGMTVAEIADFIDAPQGTIASRLRLARKKLDSLVERLRSAEDRRGEP